MKNSGKLLLITHSLVTDSEEIRQAMKQLQTGQTNEKVRQGTPNRLVVDPQELDRIAQAILSETAR